ncbi:MAG: MobF family relaxase [Blastocatellia bacterium]
MITMSKSLSVEQIISYYKNEYKKGDYFSEEGSIAGVWAGKGAEKLGLNGQVKEKDFVNLAEGKDPKTEEQLIKYRKTSETYVGHRAGFDITFSAPKSLSLTSLIGEDKRIIELHEKSVSRAMQEIEKYSMVRNGENGKDELTGNLVYAKFTHETSRALDPQLHTHVVVMNMSHHEEKGFRALQPVELYRSQELGTRIYYTELAKGLKELGYEIELGKSNGQPEIKGRSENYLAHFSQRSQQIKEELANKGLENSFYNRFNAAHETRESKKKEISKENLASWWESRTEMFDFDEKKNVEEAIKKSQEQVLEQKDRNAIKESVNLSIEHNLERNSVVEERELLTKALDIRKHLGKYTIDDVKAEISNRLDNKDLLQEQGEKGTRYTTKEMQDLERENISIVNNSRGKIKEIESQQEVKEHLKDWEAFKSKEAGKEVTLNEEQRNAAETILTSNDQVIGVQGRAGVGKSFSLSFVKSEAERNGLEFRAFTPTTKAADNLRQDGIEANTVAKLKEEIKTGELKKGGIWVIDEAGMVDARSMNTILRTAQERETKVVLVGDTRQHEAVQAGRAFDQLMKEGMQTKEISQIVRQKEENFRALVKDLSQGNTNDAINKVKSVGNVYEIKDGNKEASFDCSQERYKKMAELYIDNSQRGSVLAIAPTNRERQAINEAIRTDLKQKGEIAQEGLETQILVNKNVTGAERKLAQNYEAGDIVGYLYGSKRHGIEAGEYLRVTNVDVSNNTITVNKNNGETISYNPEKLYGIKDVYKSENREFATGDKIVFKEKNKDLEINSGSTGKVEQVNENGQLLLKMENGESKLVNKDNLKHTDHAYCMTSHKGQGTTVDNVIIHIDSNHRESMVNKTMAYVAISRARSGVSIVTNDEVEAQRAIEREYKKNTALEIKEAEEISKTKQDEVTIANYVKEQPEVGMISNNRSEKSREMDNNYRQVKDSRNIIETEREKYKEFYSYKLTDEDLLISNNKDKQIDLKNLEVAEKTQVNNINEQQLIINNNKDKQIVKESKENKNDLYFGIE